MSNAFVRGLLACLLTLATMICAEQASAEMIDDFSGATLSGEYVKTCVTTNVSPLPTPETCLTKTGFSIDANQHLAFDSYVTDGKAYQTVLLRDDHPLDPGDWLDPGERLEVDVLSYLDINTVCEIGLCIASQKTQTFNVKQDMLFVQLDSDVNSAPNTARLSTSRCNGTSRTSAAVNVVLANITGLFIERIDADSYAVGGMTAAGDIVAKQWDDYTAGAAAVGFYTDCRSTQTPLATLDNLRIVPEPGSLAVMVGGVAALLWVRRRLA